MGTPVGSFHFGRSRSSITADSLSTGHSTRVQPARRFCSPTVVGTIRLVTSNVSQVVANSPNRPFGSNRSDWRLPSQPLFATGLSFLAENLVRLGVNLLLLGRGREPLGVAFRHRSMLLVRHRIRARRRLTGRRLSLRRQTERLGWKALPICRRKLRHYLLVLRPRTD